VGDDAQAQAAQAGGAPAAAAAGAADGAADGAERALPDLELLKKPSDPAMNATAPEVFQARFETTAGAFVVEVHRAWAPRGADRFYNLVRAGFFDGVKFFRAVKGFMVQFGIHGDPAVSQHWRDAKLDDDPVIKSNTRSFVSFAMAGPNSRTTQFFINTVDRNSFLDASGFSPFGQVVSGMEVVDALYAEYDEAPSNLQGEIQLKGNAVLDEKFPKLDSIVTARLVD
jgi:peptidyl-prolyl cis-trans isomerase A (cyclophilin A)